MLYSIAVTQRELSAERVVAHQRHLHHQRGYSRKHLLAMRYCLGASLTICRGRTSLRNWQLLVLRTTNVTDASSSSLALPLPSWLLSLLFQLLSSSLEDRMLLRSATAAAVAAYASVTSISCSRRQWQRPCMVAL